MPLRRRKSRDDDRASAEAGAPVRLVVFLLLAPGVGEERRMVEGFRVATGYAALILAGALASAALLAIGLRYEWLRRLNSARKLYLLTRTPQTFSRGLLHHLAGAGFSVRERVITPKGETIVKLVDADGVVWAGILFPSLFPVTSDQVGMVLRTMAGTQARQAILFTRATFTPAAIEIAKGKPIILVDRDGLGKWIE